MGDDESIESGLDRTKVTFAQAEGVEALPIALKIGEISEQLAARLWRVCWHEIENAKKYRDHRGSVVTEPWLTIFFDWWTLHEHRFAEEFSTDHQYWMTYAKSQITCQNYVTTFEFLTFVVRHKSCPNYIPRQIQQALDASQAAYRLIDKTFIPFGTAEEAMSLSQAFADVSSNGFGGAQSHLRQAVAAVNERDYASSIRESIHAVESVARKLDPSATTLAPALKSLAAKGTVHTSLRLGFEKLYGFTNDENGLRHALIDDPVAGVDEADALYMLGSCAAFVSYLIRKTAD